jgi:PadR family transcriptional regulator PadR
MNQQFKKGVLEICILQLILKKDLYGYEIVKMLHEKFNVSESTIYPIIRRLSVEGLCETYLLESSSGPARKYYKITTKGKKHLKKEKEEWIKFNEVVKEILEK